MLKQFLLIAFFSGVIFMTGNAQSYQKTDLGIKTVINSIGIEIQFYGPLTVRVIKWPDGKAFIKKSLSVIKTPQKTSV